MDIVARSIAGRAGSGVGSIRETTLNVTDFGAIGDGVFDCTQAFVDAMNACNYRRELRIPAGNYLIRQTVTNKARRIYGEGAYVDSGAGGTNLIFRPVTFTDLMPCLHFSTMAEVIVENLSINGNKAYFVRNLSDYIDKSLFDERKYEMFESGVVGATVSLNSTVVFRSVRTRNIKIGIRLENYVGHITIYDCNLNGGFAGLYIDRNNSDYFIQGGAINGSFAGILLGTSGTNMSLKRVHLGFAPYGIYQVEDGKNYGLKGMDSCTLDDVRFEAVGECAISLLDRTEMWDTQIGGFGFSWSALNPADPWFQALPEELLANRQQYALRLGKLRRSRLLNLQYGGVRASTNVTGGRIASIAHITGTNDLSAIPDMNLMDVGRKDGSAYTTLNLERVHDYLQSPINHPLLRGGGLVNQNTNAWEKSLCILEEVTGNLAEIPVSLSPRIQEYYGSALRVFKMTPTSNQASVNIPLIGTAAERRFDKSVNIKGFLYSTGQSMLELAVDDTGSILRYLYNSPNAGGSWVEKFGVDETRPGWTYRFLRIRPFGGHTSPVYFTIPMVSLGELLPYAEHKHAQIDNDLELLGGKALILRSEDGTRHKIAVNNYGNLVITVI
ncbi:glycosyl hydrolase family 28-related protein [Paenibacillus sp. 1P07SE]|uniref:glycosyl hydrolase family 28-related protein n=1 Tax=Paenibacillus sp. 1P07SE TaxID=3132209 RepID=UPI0039A53537